MTFAALFAILVGLLVLGTWICLIVSTQVPGLKKTSGEFVFRWAAELATAVLLVGGGVGLLTDSDWGQPILLLSLGMLIYAVIGVRYLFGLRQV